MAKNKIIIISVLVLSVIIGGFYIKNNISNLYNNFTKGFQKFEKTNLENILSEVKKEIFSPPPLDVGGKENQIILAKAKIIAQTNIQRYNNGNLLPLIENSKLDATAKAKADDMFKVQYFEHVSPSDVDPDELVKSFGYDYIATGENLILGNFSSEKEVVQHWMDSPGHRANILNNRFTEIGVAIVRGVYKGDTVWIGVQEFGLPLSACQEPDNGLKVQIDLNKNKLDNLMAQIDDKRAEINNISQKSQRYNILVDEYNQLVAEYNNLNQATKNIISQYNNHVSIFNQCVVGK